MAEDLLITQRSQVQILSPRSGKRAVRDHLTARSVFLASGTDPVRARRRAGLVRVLEHPLQRNPENPGDLEGDLQGWRVPAALNGVYGLPGHPDLVTQLTLAHAGGGPQFGDPVGYEGRLAHVGLTSSGAAPVQRRLDHALGDRGED